MNLYIIDMQTQAVPQCSHKSKTVGIDIIYLHSKVRTELVMNSEQS